jgi:hypothetical protein
MRCLNCLTVCDETDTVCATCHKPPNLKKSGWTSRAPVTFWAVLFMIIGQALFNVLAPRWFPRPSGGGINMQQCMWAAVVGAFCAVLGGLVGMVAGPAVRR